MLCGIYVFINSYRSQSQAWNYTIWHWSRSQNGYFNLLPPSISIILAHRWWWQDCCTNPGFNLPPWSVTVWPHPSVKVWTCWILNEASPCTSHNPFDVSIVKHSQGAAAIIENHTKHKPGSFSHPQNTKIIMANLIFMEKILHLSWLLILVYVLWSLSLIIACVPSWVPPFHQSA